VNIATVRRLPVPGAKVPATTLPNSRGIFYSLSVNFIFYNIFQGSSSATSKLQAELELNPGPLQPRLDSLSSS
jgi:hypothetical protein